MKEEWGASRVIMGGCRHSFPLVEERICGRAGDATVEEMDLMGCLVQKTEG